VYVGLLVNDPAQASRAATIGRAAR
jgi:hypothetical protein